MTVWLVAWTVQVITACAPSSPDAYGRSRTDEPAVICTRSEEHVKRFASKEEAEGFIQNAPQSWDLSDFKVLKETE